jgi:hypothetical protein
METQGGSYDNAQGQPDPAITAEANIGATAPPEDGDQQKDAGRAFYKRLQGFSPIFELAVALAAVAGIVFVTLQTWFMWESNRQTRESNGLTRASNAMTEAANKRTLALMEESNRLTREALEESRRQSEASLAQSAKQGSAELNMSRQSLRESREALALSQRARLVVDRFEMGGEPKQPIGIVHIKNTGAAPATEVRWNVGVMEAQSSAEIPPPLYISLRMRPVTVIGGGGTYALEAKARETGSGMFYLFGHVQYMDGFGTPRVTEFCAYYFYLLQPLPQRWEPCYQNNTVDWHPGERERLHWPSPPYDQQ